VTFCRLVHYGYMRKIILVLFGSFAFCFLGAQNLIKNPGLEIIDTSVVITQYEDSFQVHHIPGWYNPGFTTTDYFNSDGQHGHVGSRNFGREIKAHSGVGFAGFYTENTKWREYIGIDFTEALVAGNNYHIEMYLATSVKCKYAMMCLQLEFWDTTYMKIQNIKMNYPRVNPKYPAVYIMQTGQAAMIDNWIKFSTDFTAVGGEKSMILGYFDDLYRTFPLPLTPKNRNNDAYAYNYIDDVSLVRVDGPPISRKIISRPIIYFDVNKAIIKPEYFDPLDDVVDRMKKNARLKIEVDGYTDVDATDSFNLKLSQRRAQAVADYIISKGIDPSRITVKWFAEQMQVSDEKALNRRVEFRYFEN
jgi:outer membrane protein OmpA-like peptidoglycan-associated protein